MPKFIDLSIAIEADVPSDPPMMIPKIQYCSHEEGAEQMKLFFPGIDPEKDLPKGKGWTVEFVQLSTHSGTHLDAPWHYHPTMDGGIKALTIDEVPLEWCTGHGVKLDFRHFPDGYLVSAADMDVEFKRIGYSLKEGDIVLVNTGSGQMVGEARLSPQGMRHGKGSHAMAPGARRSRGGHRCLELGQAPSLYCAGVRGNR